MNLHVSIDLGSRVLLAAAGIAAILNAPEIRAQALPSFTFETASVKPGVPGNIGGSTYDFTPGGGLRVTNGTLKGLLETAYDVRDFQISGGPGWVNSERYDILARSASPADIKETRLKVQSLLAERFRLRVHRDTKELPVYVLAVARTGSKLAAGQVASAPEGINAGCGQMIGTRTSMANLAVKLSRQLDRPVLDRTGLSGKYDFRLDWTPDTGPCSTSSSPDSPSLFTALQEELGLKLESTKGPVEVLVIDQVEKPSEN
jgi:bla regulator protein BlaR1